MYRIGDKGATYRSLPPNMVTDRKKLIAFCNVVDKRMAELRAIVNKLLVWGDLDNVDPRYYDALASCLDAPYYRSDYDDATKLGIIKTAIMKRRYAGTKKAVKSLIGTVYDNGAYIPWYEYGGEPYHFKVRANSLGQYVRMSVKDVKSKRSVLEQVETVLGIADRELVVVHAEASPQVLVRQGLNTEQDVRDTEAVYAGTAASPEILVRSGLDSDQRVRAAESAYAGIEAERTVIVGSRLNAGASIDDTEAAAANIGAARSVSIRSGLNSQAGTSSTLANHGTVNVSIGTQIGGKDA